MKILLSWLNEYGDFADPTDSEAIGRALGEVLSDGWLCADLIALGRARAAACTWERCARATLSAYRELVE